MNRRNLLVSAALGASVVAMSGCATTGGGGHGPSWPTIKTYVADAVATFDKLVPLVIAMSPATAVSLQKVQASADAAAAAFAQLTDPTSAGNQAQTVITLISDGLTIVAGVPGIPGTWAAAISAAQVLLFTVGTFFSVAPLPSPSARPGEPDRVAAAWEKARTYGMSPEQAQASVRRFLASRRDD